MDHYLKDLHEATRWQYGADPMVCGQNFANMLTQYGARDDLLVHYGWYLFNHRRMNDGLTTVRQHLHNHPKHLLGRCVFAQMLIQLGQFQPALAILLENIEHDAQHALSLETLAILYHQLHAPEKAGDFEVRALASYREQPPAHLSTQQVTWSIAKLLERQGDIIEAISCYQELLQSSLEEQRPCDLWFEQLANCLYRAKRKNEAKKLFERWLVYNPTHPVPQHMLQSFAENPPTACPPDYVQQLFDGFASSFEQTLVQALDYRMHEQLPLAIVKAVSPPPSSWRIADIGCGTGLAGPSLKSFAKQLVGIDISGKMIEQAKARGVYDELVVGEIIQFFAQDARSFDLIHASDVVIYFGDVSQLIAAVAASLRPQGIFACTIEQASEACSADYELQHNGRFAHHCGYIESQIREQSFEILSCTPCEIRKELHTPVHGFMLVAKLSET